MPRIQRNAKVLVLVLLATALSTGTWWLAGSAQVAIGPAGPVAQIGGPVTPLGAAESAALWGLLADIALDRDALIALNVAQEQAEGVLSALRAWEAQQHDVLGGLRAQITAQLASVHRLDKAVRAGTAEPAELEAALAALAAARIAYTSRLSGLRAALSAELTESQRATWRVIAHGWGQEMPLRMLALTTEQRQAYGRALQRHRLALAAARTAEQRAALVAAWQQAQEEILTADNQQVIAAYNSYADQAAQALHAAEQAVMPTQNQVG